MKIYLITFLCFFSCLCIAKLAPSFDCGKARTDVEHAICTSPVVSQMDRKMSLLYRQYIIKLSKEDAVVAKKMQRLWLSRQGQCSDIDNLSECIKNNYSEWLEAMNKGVLLTNIPIDKNNSFIVSPFNGNIKYDLMTIPSKEELLEGELKESYVLNLIEGGTIKNLHRGNFYYYGIQLYEDKVQSISFYLSSNGKRHVALQQSYADYGGRCGASRNKTLNFLSISDNHKKFKSVVLSEADEACGVYHNELYDWEVKLNGNLVFYELDDYSFYYHATFTEILATEVDSQNGLFKNYYWIDPSKDNYLGVPYKQIIEEVKSEILSESYTKGTKLCLVPGNGLHDYKWLKGILSRYKIGFNQIEFYSKNFLVPEALKAGLKYQPLLEAALLYLDKAREIPDWENRLINSAKKYPQIQATASYYYNGSSEWDVNPFIEAGFYTDSTCYSRQPSPWSHASMEEWYYLFWARRIDDGNLERAEGLLKLIVELMSLNRP